MHIRLMTAMEEKLIDPLNLPEGVVDARIDRFDIVNQNANDQGVSIAVVCTYIISYRTFS